MISDQHLEESLSISYVNAVVSYSGHTYNIRSKDYGVDGSVNIIDSLSGKLMDMGAAFDCQLKSTINWSIKNNVVLYDIDSESYNKIIYRNNHASLPCYLVLLCLPKEKINWLSVHSSQLVLKECCYYYLITGEITKNQESKRLHIPITNIFNSQAVTVIANSSRKAVV